MLKMGFNVYDYNNIGPNSVNECENVFSLLLQEHESYIPMITNELNLSKVPLFLFGAGVRANSVYRALKEIGLAKIDEVVVSDQYANDNLVFNGITVKPFSSAINNYEMVNVIIGISVGVYEIADELRECKKVNKLLFIDLRPDERCSKSENIMNFISDHDECLFNFYKNLADDKSRETMCAYFNQMISGLCNYIDDVYESDQYFPDFIKLNEDEIYVDCGAYDGDTIHKLLSALDDKKHNTIYAFEPDRNSFNKLIRLCDTIPNLKCFNIGTWHESTNLCFSHSGGPGSSIIDAGDAIDIDSVIRVDTIDNIVQDAKVTYIKMDVEGAELNTLLGAKKTIQNNKPKLAVSAYHRLDDLVLIPNYLKKLVPEYKSYLRAHSRPYCDELVLYAL